MKFLNIPGCAAIALALALLAGSPAAAKYTSMQKLQQEVEQQMQQQMQQEQGWQIFTNTSQGVDPSAEKDRRQEQREPMLQQQDSGPPVKQKQQQEQRQDRGQELQQAAERNVQQSMEKEQGVEQDMQRLGQQVQQQTEQNMRQDMERDQVETQQTQEQEVDPLIQQMLQQIQQMQQQEQDQKQQQGQQPVQQEQDSGPPVKQKQQQEQQNSGQPVDQQVQVQVGLVEPQVQASGSQEQWLEQEAQQEQQRVVQQQERKLEQEMEWLKQQLEQEMEQDMQQAQQEQQPAQQEQQPVQQEQQQEQQQTQGEKGNYVRAIPVEQKTVNVGGLQGALDALRPFSPDQAEILAGMVEKLLGEAEKSGMTLQTLRQLLTDLQTLPQNRWLSLIGKYKPSQALIAAVLEAMKQIESMGLGVTLTAQQALDMADEVLKALEAGWSPQWIAMIKKSKEAPVVVVRAAVTLLKDTEAFLAGLAMAPGTGTARMQLPENLNIQTLGDELRPGGPGQATIRGGLINSFSRPGNYGFAVDLSSGQIRNGFMNGGFGSGGESFAVSGGSGTVSGNNFALSGFNGSITTSGGTAENVSSATLNGTAAKGFGSVGDIGAGGSYTVTGVVSPPDSGTITGGQRVN